MPSPPSTGLVPVDAALQQVVREVVGFQRDHGVMVSPRDNLSGTLALVDEGETVLLLPGEHFFTADLVVSRRVRLVGLGRVRLRFYDAKLSVTGADVSIEGIEFVRDVRSAAAPVVQLSGVRGHVDRCTFDGPSVYGVRVSGNYCAVRACRFLPHASHAAADADCYWQDGVTYGIVSGNSWSGTRTYVLDYQAAFNMSQAANGPGPPPGIVNERP